MEYKSWVGAALDQHHREEEINELLTQGWRIVSVFAYTYNGVTTVEYALVRETSATIKELL